MLLRSFGGLIRVLICCLLGLGLVSAESITLPNGNQVEIPDGLSDEQKAKVIQQMTKDAGGAAKPKPEQDAEKGKKEKPGDKDKKNDKDNKDGDKKKDTIKRPDKPPKDPDLAELDAMPSDGKLILQFQGHSWPSMITWYSRATGRDIQWQELPSDWVNLRTQRPYTMAETGDMLNRLLLAHGFTILDDGEFMQVVKTEGLNPAFVPRVKPQQLATLQPYSFVRVSYQLHRFKAEELVSEFEAMKSKHGKLVAMKAANRIEAMDCVQNLRDIYAAIDAEQSSGDHAPREFVIEWLRADMVKKKLEEMFGGGDAAGPPLTPQQIQQMQQMQQQQQQKGQQPPKPPGGNAKTSIVVNELRNSIIVKATPRIMIDIDAAVQLLDVQPRRDALDIKAYSLSTRSPTEVSQILSESGALSPDAIVRVDKKTKALLVSASAVDHFRIEQLIKAIDGNPRRFVPIRLRRLPAIQVATTIESMMGKPKEDDSRRRRYGYWWDDQEEEDDSNDTFRITADVESNRLILKCNDQEYDMVVELLTQMGEVMTQSNYGGQREIVLDGVEAEDALLERVRDMFNASAPNEVILPPPSPSKEPNEKDEKTEPAEAPKSTDPTEESPATETPTSAVTGTDRPAELIGRISVVESFSRHSTPAEIIVTDRFTDIIPRRKTPSGSGLAVQSPYETLLVQSEGASEEEFDQAVSKSQEVRRNQKKAPPIIIRRDRNGRLVIRSDDPAALERFEELLRQMAPPTQDWVHFKLTHVTALWMKLQLQDFFKDEDDEPASFFVWGWGGDDREDKSPPGLGDERTMRFIDDGESTLVVRNASAKQLATVEELIKLYDIAEPPNEQNARFTEMILIKHSKARVIETVLKDAFRDLLSSTDKAFAQQNSGGGEGEGRNRRIGPFSMPSASTSAFQGTSFKGKISFGVDETTNRLIVTAEGRKLLELVKEYVDKLDVAAIDTIDDTRVVTVPKNINRNSLRETLVAMFGPDSVQVQQKPGQEQPQEGQQKGQQGQPQQQPNQQR